MVLGVSPVSAHEVELGGGVLVPLDGDDRKTFGAVPLATAGLAFDLVPGSSWFLVEIGWMEDTIDPRFSDPTFARPDPRLRVFPIVLGVRADAVPAVRRKNVAFRFGVGLQTTVGSFRDEAGTGHHAAGWGLRFELGPRILVAGAWSIWARQILTLATDIDFGATAMNLSGTGFEAGLSYRLGDGS